MQLIFTRLFKFGGINDCSESRIEGRGIIEQLSGNY